MERRCPDDSCEKHPATSVDGDKTGLKLESSSSLDKPAKYDLIAKSDFQAFIITVIASLT